MKIQYLHQAIALTLPQQVIALSLRFSARRSPAMPSWNQRSLLY
ncbi:hypothetical protein [Nostoc sp. PCC 9305]